MTNENLEVLPGLLDVEHDAAGFTPRRGHAPLAQKLGADLAIRRLDPAQIDVWEANTRDATTLADLRIAILVESIKVTGQQVPAICRPSPTDPSRLELVSGVLRLAAIRKINEGRPKHAVPLLVEVRAMDDRQAFALVDAENRVRTDIAPIERARSYQFAITRIYGTEAALAEALTLNKSSVSRTLDVARLPAEVRALVTDVREISAAQASSFMTAWREDELRPTLLQLAAELQKGGPAAASNVFEAFRAATAVSSGASEVCLAVETETIGRLRRRASGALAIELKAGAAKYELKVILRVLSDALRGLPRS